MPRRDQLDELDQKIAAILQSAAEELREELVERLQETRDRLHRLVRDIARAEDDRPVNVSSSGDLPALREATAALVQAATQEEILDRLLSGASRFCGRVAFFLVDERQARLWGSRGLGAEIEQLTVSIEGNRPWECLLSEQGALRLSAAESLAVLGGDDIADFEATPGALVPFPLADRLAGALWADDPESAKGPDLAPLQLLAQAASGCLESLSLRSRRLPIALRQAKAGRGPADRLELWSAARDERREGPRSEEE